jgi:hypothetical protein
MNAMLLSSTSTARKMYLCTTALCLAAAFLVLAAPFAAAQQPLPDPVVHLTFDDPNDLGNDSSGNGRHGVVGSSGVTWQDDAERRGVADFTDTAFSADTSIMVDLGGPLPGDDFTVSMFMTSRINGGSFFQLEPNENPPVAQSGTFEKVVWGGLQGSGFVWGRIVENGTDFSGLDTDVYRTELNEWHHYTYRARADATSSSGFRFEVFVDGIQQGPQTEYLGTLNTHGQLNVGATQDGRVDDVRVYAQALSDGQVKELTLGTAPQPLLHLTFDCEADPLADSSGNGVVSTSEGAIGPSWANDAERGGVMSFPDGAQADAFICSPVPLGDGTGEFTIACWAKDPDPVALDGLFVMHREGGADGLGDPCLIEGSNDWRSWIGSGSPGVWGRVADDPSFAQVGDRNTPVLDADVWTHIALRATGTDFELLTNGVVTATAAYDAPWGLVERILIGTAHVGCWAGSIDDFRAYNIALTNDQIGGLLLPQLPQPLLHLKFDDELDPLVDSSGNGVVSTSEGAVGPSWHDDPDRRGCMSFPDGAQADAFICSPVDLGDGSGEFTISMWAQDPDPTQLDGLFVMHREGGADGLGDPCLIEGSNDWRSWIGSGSPGVWGRVADTESFAQVGDRNTPVLSPNEWTHIALTANGTDFQLYINGTLSVTQPYDAPWNLVERILIGTAHVGCWAGLIDDFRAYKQALSADQLGTIISGPCPADGDTHCLGLSIEGPPQRKRGIYRITADASDDGGDIIFYTFLAEKTGDPSATQLIESQRDNPNASFYLSPGEWQISVTVDDSPCPDVAPDATCSLDALNLLQVIPGEPSLDNIDWHFSFNDPNDPLVDNSGNGFVANWSPVGSEQWVDDPERGGVLEFPGVVNELEADRDPEDGYIKVKDGPKAVGIDPSGIENAGGGFTICVWVKQFSDASAPGTFGSGGIMNYSNCCDEDGDGVIGDPSVTPGDHDGPGWNWNPLNPDRLTNAAVTVGAGDPNDPSFAFTWIGGDGAPRGGNIGGKFPVDTWTHFCLRGSIPDVHPTQALFTHRVETVINGTQLPDVDGNEPPFAHSRENFGLQLITRAYLGKGGNPQSASFRGRLDDWRHYDRMLDNTEIQEVMEGFVEPFDIDYIRGDADGLNGPDVSDAIGMLTYLFLGGFETTCLDTLDFDGSTIIDVSDPLNFLQWLFLGTYTPPNPQPPACGLPDDPLTRISCESFAPCE